MPADSTAKPSYDNGPPPQSAGAMFDLGFRTGSTMAFEVTQLVQPGDFIGPYRLLQKIGVGGFGDVWRAEQLKPIHREVALKVIKAGMDSAEIIARFEAERQALALMDHPNIAAVLDAGTTQQGRPYFAMELVKGSAITTFCDERKLTVRQRLDIFIPVCLAVQHAHQKAILHRDLKPSNILIAEVDGKPVAKVIDFGIAKALGTSPESVLRSSLAQTREGLLIGTPQYMSPEQAGSVADVDTRSDIYTLGIILYELLTGQTPLSSEQLHKAALDEVLRLVREAEPKRPSSRMIPVTEAVRLHATERHADPLKLSHSLRGDLDWIVFMALAKERERRYQTANALAMDIERHLRDEPVNAGPPSAAYRLKKLVRRKKGVFLAGAAVLLCLIAGVVATSIALWREQEALMKVIEQKQLAQTNEKRAQQEAEKARRVAAFLGSLLQGAAAEVSRGKNADALIAAIERQVPKVPQDLGDQPEVQYRVMVYLASIYHQFDMHREGLPLTRQALSLARQVFGNDHEETLGRIAWIAVEERQVGDRDEAIRLFQEVIARRQALGQTTETSDALFRNIKDLIEALDMRGRGEEARILREQAVAVYRGRDSRGELTDPNHRAAYAGLLRDSGLQEDALRILQEFSSPAFSSPKGFPLAKLLIEQMRLERALGREADALRTCERAMALEKQRPDKWQVAVQLLHYVRFLRDGKHWDLAEKALGEALAVAQRSGHQVTLSAVHNTARDLFSSQGKFDEAETHARVAWEAAKKGTPGWPAITQQWWLVDALARNMKVDEAIRLAEEMWKTASDANMADQPVTVRHQLADDVARLFRDINAQASSAEQVTLVKLWRTRAADSVPWNDSTSPSDFDKMLTTVMWRMAWRVLDGDTDGYQRDQLLLLARCKGMPDVRLARAAGKVLLLLPGEGAVLHRAIELAVFAHRSLPEGDPDYLRSSLTRGLAHYRAGEHAEALRVLRPALAKNSPNPTFCAAAIAAMAEQRLGHHDSAMALLKLVDQRRGSGPAWLDDPYEQDAAISRVLFAEARALIKP